MKEIFKVIFLSAGFLVSSAVINAEEQGENKVVEPEAPLKEAAPKISAKGKMISSSDSVFQKKTVSKSKHKRKYSKKNKNRGRGWRNAGSRSYKK